MRAQGRAGRKCTLHDLRVQMSSVSRKPLTLVECHLFTFELCDNKVIADGFEDADPYHQRAQVHRSQ